jgi:hypothetical protein
MGSVDISRALSEAIAGTPVHASALYLLSNVPGFPPIVQTVHLLSISAIMGSSVLLNLKLLGMALPSQPAGELVRRLMPWTWAALPLNAASGLVFIFAQPYRYFDNPMFQLKFSLLVPAIVLALIIQRRRTFDGPIAKLLALLSLTLWTGVVMAGRWIAYVDYLWPVE